MTLVAGTSERWGGDPRYVAADALATFLEMSDAEWKALWASPGVPHGLTPAEQEGLAAAVAQRLNSVIRGERCPGCHVVCASLDVEHLDSCPHQGRNALRLTEKGERE